MRYSAHEEKSHVGMETKTCPVCGKEHETGALLFDKLLRPVFARHTCTGWELCPEHRKQCKEGFMFLVEVSATVPPDNPPRTELVITIKKELAARIFDEPPCDVAYITPDATEKLRQLMRANGLEVPEQAETA